MAAAESMIDARRALDELYRGHAAEVYRYAYAVLGNHADAEDVTQTTFVNALRALERGERPRKPSNWLITIAHNIIRQRFRQQQARPAEVELVRDVPDQPGEDSGPSMEELVRALQRIPQSQREALVLRELEGRSYDEIAETLGLTKSALETLLFRARRSLADEIENAATCERAELDLSRQLDGRLSRKERKRLLDHIAECPSCARLQVTQGRQRRAFKGLALLPLPLSLTLFKGAPSASAAVGLPTIGAASTAAVVGGGGAATGGGITLGGLAIGGVAVKAAAVVAAVSVAGGVGYVGTQEVRHARQPATPPSEKTLARNPAASGNAAGTTTQRAATAAAKANRRAARVEPATANHSAKAVAAAAVAAAARRAAPSHAAGGKATKVAHTRRHVTPVPTKTARPPKVATRSSTKAASAPKAPAAGSRPTGTAKAAAAPATKAHVAGAPPAGTTKTTAAPATKAGAGSDPAMTTPQDAGGEAPAGGNPAPKSDGK